MSRGKKLYYTYEELRKWEIIGSHKPPGTMGTHHFIVDEWGWGFSLLAASVAAQESRRPGRKPAKGE